MNGNLIYFDFKENNYFLNFNRCIENRTGIRESKGMGFYHRLLSWAFLEQLHERS